jgi:hypothetical protein
MNGNGAAAFLESFRAQWSYDPAPAGFRDVPWIFSYPIAPNTTGGLIQFDNYPLPVDDDADFLVRGLWAADLAAVAPSGSAMVARLRDGSDHRLADDLQPLFTLFSNVNGVYGLAPLSSLRVPAPLEPEIRVRASGLLTAELYCPADAGPYGALVTLYLVGVKRFAECAA